jgi:hypothetical protein
MPQYYLENLFFVSFCGDIKSERVLKRKKKTFLSCLCNKKKIQKHNDKCENMYFFLFKWGCDDDVKAFPMTSDLVFLQGFFHGIHFICMCVLNGGKFLMKADVIYPYNLSNFLFSFANSSNLSYFFHLKRLYTKHSLKRKILPPLLCVLS